MGVIIAAIVGAFGAVGAASIGLINRKKLNEIHLLVNSRLDQALDQISDLKTQRDRAQGIEDAGKLAKPDNDNPAITEAHGRDAH